MRSDSLRLAAFPPLLLVLGAGPALALEAPLSRASFERALEEGRACESAELWKAIQNSPMVSLTTNERLPPDDQLEDGVTSETVRSGGPRVQRVSIRRGRDRDRATVGPVSEGGVAFDFPAEALQGSGPFYVVVHMESPSIDQAVKLKPSALAKP